MFDIVIDAIVAVVVWEVGQVVVPKLANKYFPNKWANLLEKWDIVKYWIRRLILKS